VSSDTRCLLPRRNTDRRPPRIPTGHLPGGPPTATRLPRVNMEHLPKDEPRRIAANIAKLPELLKHGPPMTQLWALVRFEPGPVGV
jgi:hypothetical protein